MKNARILLVEDNPTDVLLTRRAFSDMDMDVDMIVASDGEIAMKILKKEEEYAETVLPQLVLLDINLPRKNGKEVLREIKSCEGLKHMPVMMLTTSDADRDVQEAYQAHCNSYTVKPANAKQFRDFVRVIEAFWFEISKLPRNLH
jgi:Response regulators consisting of a CheY-like receiver domain and a winged-helix DNA-binding domain